MLREQAEHVTYIVARMLSEGLTQVEATVAAEEAWQLEIAAVNAARAPFQEQCTPGYFNAEGRKGDTRSGIATGSYRPSPQFFRSWRAWRDSGDFEGLAVS
jgi:cyclohexanone monooxygenase